MASKSVSASSMLAWKCPRCRHVRSISTAVRQQLVGPEHPRYIEVPEPPQPTAPTKAVVKGSLPIPRNIFSGTPKDQSTDAAIAQATPLPSKAKRPPPPGSRLEWKTKMAELRRQNLQDGIKALRVRQQKHGARLRTRSDTRQVERAALLARPEREDERLTTASVNLDLKQLFSGAVPDPARAQRLERKRANLTRVAAEQRADRIDGLHTLYMNARDFIVTPPQLEKAIDDAFGTEEKPVTFGGLSRTNPDFSAASIWSEGRPQRIQDMLNRANKQSARVASDDNIDSVEITGDRVRRIAEKLTGGTMDTRK